MQTRKTFSIAKIRNSEIACDKYRPKIRCVRTPSRKRPLLLDSRMHKSLTFRWLLKGGLAVVYFHLQVLSPSLSDAIPVTEL